MIAALIPGNIGPISLSGLTFNLFIFAVVSAAQQSENLCEMGKGLRHLDEGTQEDMRRDKAPY